MSSADALLALIAELERLTRSSMPAASVPAAARNPKRLVHTCHNNGDRCERCRQIGWQK